MHIEQVMALLLFAAVALLPAVASLVCWFRGAQASLGFRVFAGLHGLVFLGAAAAGEFLAPIAAQQRDLILPLFICAVLVVLFAFASVICAFVVHRRSVLVLLLLVAALPVEAYLSLAAVAGATNSFRRGFFVGQNVPLGPNHAFHSEGCCPDKVDTLA